MKISFSLICLIAVLCTTSCQQKQKSENAYPEKLIFGVSPGTDPGLRQKMMKPIGEYLTKKTGVPIEFFFSTDYTALIEALKAKKVDLADLPPFAYVIASKSANISPIVVLGVDGKPVNYSSMIIASKQSKLTNIEQVRSRAKELTLCFSDPASASGHLVPNAYLTTIGLEPKTSFKGVVFGGGHLGAVMSVKSGKVDLGCTTQIVMHMIERKKSIKKDDYTVIWTSDPIAGQPIVARNDFNQELVKKIRDAYLNMYKDAPDVLENYLKVYLDDPGKRSYMAANDSMYNGLRKLSAGLKDLN